MRKFIVTVMIIGAALAFAAPPPKIDVRTELTINGKVVPREQIRLKVKAKPTSAAMDEILVDMDLTYKSGDKTIRSTPQVYAKAGSEAVMTLEESTKQEKIVLKVLARPVQIE